MVKISELISSGAERLKGVADNPRLEARMLLAHALSVNVSSIIIHMENDVSADKKELFDSYISMRMTHKPIAYITGKKEFFGLSLMVNEHTLIPRPETELIVEEVLSYNKKNLLDLCTGSGCIPIAAAKNSDITATGVDISAEAVKVAEQNAKNHSLENRVNFIVRDVFENDYFGKFDIITSNPPYITDEDMSALPPDVADFEPHTALAGGVDGLKFYRRITDIAPQNLIAGGMLIFEIGVDEAEAVARLMEKKFNDIKIKNDLSGIARIVTGRLKETKYV